MREDKPPLEPTPEERRKVARAQWILHGAMALMGAGLFLAIWLASRKP